MNLLKKIEKPVFWLVTALLFPFMHLTHLDDFGYFSGAGLQHLFKDSLLYQMLRNVASEEIGVSILLFLVGLLCCLMLRRVLPFFSRKIKESVSKTNL